MDYFRQGEPRCAQIETAAAFGRTEPRWGSIEVEQLLGREIRRWVEGEEQSLATEGARHPVVEWRQVD